MIPKGQVLKGIEKYLQKNKMGGCKLHSSLFYNAFVNLIVGEIPTKNTF